MASTFADRMVRAARLDARLFEEVEADRSATAQALGVVALSSIAAGLGLGQGIGGIVAGILIALLGWYVWAFLTYWIGTRVLAEPATRADHGELLRTIGFASAPGLIRVLGIVPALRPFVFVAAALWMLIAGIIAVRQALDYRSTARAVAVVLVGWIVQWLLVGALVALLPSRTV